MASKPKVSVEEYYRIHNIHNRPVGVTQAEVDENRDRFQTFRTEKGETISRTDSSIAAQVLRERMRREDREIFGN
jgi:hypothetical protein